MIPRPFRVLGPSLRRHRVDLVIAVGMAVAAQAVGIGLPLLTRWGVKRAAPDWPHGGGAAAVSLADLLKTLGMVLAGLALLRGCCVWQQTMRGERLAQGVVADLRGRMYRHLQLLSQGYFDKRPSGKILIRFVGDATALRTWLARTVLTVPADVLTLGGVAIAIGTIHPQLLFGVALPLLLLVPVLIWINPRTRRWTREGRRHQSRLCALLTERVAALPVIKACNAQPADQAQVQEMIDRVAHANVRRGRLDAWSQSLSAVAATTALGAVVFSGVWLHGHDQVNHGDLLAAVWMTLLLRGPINRLAHANANHQRARVALERIAALLDRQVEPGWSPELPPYSGPGQRIELKRVGYQDAQGNWIIRDLSAVLRGPALVAVIDPGIQAASLLLELLLRIRRPHKGKIRLDGQDARKVRVADIRRQMGWVDAGRRLPHILSLSRRLDRAALRGGKEEAAWKLTERIAPDRPFAQYLEALNGSKPHGTWDGGIPSEFKLRVALCCALAHDPPILLLDDPTLGLKADAVLRLIEWLQDASRGRLVIVATNDPSIIRSCTVTLELGATPALAQEV